MCSGRAAKTHFFSCACHRAGWQAQWRSPSSASWPTTWRRPRGVVLQPSRQSCRGVAKVWAKQRPGPPGARNLVSLGKADPASPGGSASTHSLPPSLPLSPSPFPMPLHLVPLPDPVILAAWGRAVSDCRTTAFFFSSGDLAVRIIAPQRRPNQAWPLARLYQQRLGTRAQRLLAARHPSRPCAALSAPPVGGLHGVSSSRLGIMTVP